MAELSPLVAHYVAVIGLIERTVLDHVPRVPFLPAPTGMTNAEVLAIAQRFAQAHEVAVAARLTERDAA